MYLVSMQSAWREAVEADVQLSRSWLGVRSWCHQLQSGLPMPTKRLPGHSSQVTTSALSSDGVFLFSGSKDDTIRIWNLPTIVEWLPEPLLPFWA